MALLHRREQLSDGQVASAEAIRRHYTALAEEGADLEGTAAGSTHWAWQERMEALPWWWVPIKHPEPPLDRAGGLIDLKHRQGAKATYWQALEALLIESQDLRQADRRFAVPTGQASVILRSGLGDHVRATDALEGAP